VEGDPLTGSDALTAAARDWAVLPAAPATLAALVALAECLGLGEPDVARVDQPALPVPWARTRSAGCCAPPAGPARPGTGPGAARAAVRDRTGLRLAEAAALDVDDVPTTERTGTVHVRAGKRERPRTVPLPADARSRLRCWLDERTQHPAALRSEPALWLGRRGQGRLSARPLQRIVAELGAAGGLQRAHPAAHRDDPLAARRRRRGRGGHASLDTTRRYALPAYWELAAAVEAGAVEY
jgi:integrase